MAVKHIVAWEFADGLDNAGREKVASEIKTRLEALRGAVKGIKEITVYTEVLETSMAKVILNSLFEDEDALAEYQIHPDHKSAGEYIRGVTKNRFCIDYYERSAPGGEKPEFLYHGSMYLLDVIKPQPARGQSPEESMHVIYACEDPELVVPFALPIRWFPDDPSGRRSFYCEDGKTRIEYGSLDPEGFGYIYKLSSEKFKKLDGWQWIAAEEVEPVEVIKIKVSDYKDKVSFSDEAAKINEEIYGK